MDIIKPYSRRSFIMIFVIMVLLGGAVAGAVYYGKTELAQKMSHLVEPDMTPTDLLTRIVQLNDVYAIYLISLSAGLLLLFTIVLWLALKRVAKRTLAGAPPAKKAKKSIKKKDDQKPLVDQRLFLHLLVVLQREGRLLDFFQEDLDMYEDEQIGAAVRNVHGSCKKIINKNLAMEPVVSGSEGDEIEVKSGFDPDAIKLTGRVTGEPPFKGIIRHKGWRAGKLDLPDLSAEKDPSVISPAEVEIE